MMYFYLLPEPPDGVCIQMEHRGTYVVSSMTPISGREPASDDELFRFCRDNRISYEWIKGWKLCYSVRATLQMTDQTALDTLLSKYPSEKAVLMKDEETGLFSIEIWVNTPEDKDSLFSDVKQLVDQYGESADWHECPHDGTFRQPCVIAETYTRG